MTLTHGARVRRGRTRGVTAAVIVVAWLVAMGGLVQRDVLRTMEQRMTELALRVNPGAVFYAVELDGRHIGYASSNIDTLPDTSATFLVVRDAMVADLPASELTRRTTIRSEVSLTRGFVPLAFLTEVDSGRLARVSGRVEDSTITYVREPAGAVADTQRLHVAPPFLLPSLTPLATILENRPRAGRRATYQTFDPATGSALSVTLQVLAESLFVVDDSARMDVPSGRWVPALRDTVRAWHVTSADGPGFDGWVDAQGRVVEMSRAPGLRLRRMAGELAFENWRLEGEARAAIARRDQLQ